MTGDVAAPVALITGLSTFCGYDLTSFNLFETLSREPRHVDLVIREVGLPPGRVSAILTRLQLKGLARESAGKMFYRN